MPMPSSAAQLMNNLQASFVQVLSRGYLNAIGDVYDLMSILMTIELVVVAIAWGFSRAPVLAELFWKLLGFAVLLWIITSWVSLGTTAREGFIQAGLAVGNNVITVQDFNNPGNLADFGFSVTAVVFARLKELSWWRQSSEILYSGLTSWLIVTFYCGVAIQVFMANLEYAIVSAALIFLVPFLAFQKTAFIGERVFGTILNHGVRLMLLALVVNIVFPVLQQYELPKDPTFQQVFMLFLASLVFLALSLSALMLAHGMIQGTPVMSSATMLHALTTMAQTGAVLGAVGSAASLAGAGAVRAGITGASAMHAAAHIGADQQVALGGPGRVVSTAVGGAQGMGSYALGRLTSGFREAVRQGRTRARNTLS